MTTTTSQSGPIKTFDDLFDGLSSLGAANGAGSGIVLNKDSDDESEHGGGDGNAVNVDIGVPGAFFRGGQPFLSAKTQSGSAKKYLPRGGPIFPILFCQADVPCFCVTLFCHVLILGKNC